MLNCVNPRAIFVRRPPCLRAYLRSRLHSRWTVRDDARHKIVDSQGIGALRALARKDQNRSGVPRPPRHQPIHLACASSARHGASAKLIQHAQFPSCLSKRGGLSGLRCCSFRLTHGLACAGLREPLAFRRLSPRNLRRTAVAFELMTLPYSYDALEPYMSAETLHYHHDKHHQAYVDMLNKLLPGSGFEGKSLEEIVKASYGKNQGVFNNAAQDFNHNQFWPWMKKGGGGKKVPGSVLALIDRDLGGFDKFREAFIEAGKTQFGSGWCWLAMKDGKLEVSKTPNGENPLVHGGWPLLGCDVWEHSYYIDYRNLRPKYLEAWFDNLINWDHVEEMFALAPQ